MSFVAPGPPAGDGKYQSFTIRSTPYIDTTDVPLGELDVPAGGFVANGHLYTFFITDDSNRSLLFGGESLGGGPCFDATAVIDGDIVVCPGGRTVLARQESGSTFTPLYFTSQYYDSTSPSSPGAGKFVNIAPVLGSEITDQNLDAFLPPGMVTSSTLFLFGSSNWARVSDVYLAVVSLQDLETFTTAPPYALGKPWPAGWHYFTGLVGGLPQWSQSVLEAAPLLGSQTAGELSVRYVPNLETATGQPTASWLMLVGGGPGSFPASFFSAFMAARSAALPWGPWSAPQVAFDPFQPTGSGTQLAGYGNFIHGCIPTSNGCVSTDGLYDPGAEGVAGQIYAPYLVPPTLFESVGDPTRTQVSFAMSTFDPYETDLMQMQVGIDTDGDGIADAVDNCPTVKNIDQQDTNFIAEQQIDVDTNCHGQGCYLPTTPLPSSLGIAEEGRPPQPSDNPNYGPYWHQYYPGDACDGNATAAVTQGPYRVAGTTIPNVASLSFYGFIGNAAGDAAQANSTTGASFCECPFATSPDATMRVQCLTSSVYDCVLAKDALYPPIYSLTEGWKTMSGVTEVGLTHWELSDDTVGSYDPAHVSEPWAWTFDLAKFGLSPLATSMTGAYWSHVRDDDSFFRPGPGEGQPVANTPNAYVATTVSRTTLTPHLPLPCSEAPVLMPLQYAPDPTVPPWGCFIEAQGLLNLLVQTPIQTVVAQETSPGAQPLFDAIAAGAAQVVVGDDMASGLPFGFTGAPALVVQTGNLNVLGGLQLQDGAIGSVGGPPTFTAGPDPQTLRAYAALDGNLFGLTTAGGSVTFLRSNVQRALAGNPLVVSHGVVGDTPSNAQAMVWSRGDGNLWVLDAAPADRGKSALRLVRVDLLGGAAQAWKLREAEGLPSEMFLSASGQGEILVGLSVDEHSEVALLDAHGRALASVELRGSLLSTPIATSTGIGMPMARPPVGDHTNLDVRFIPRRDLDPGLCGAPWLRAHADVESARALQDGDHDQDDCRRRERP